MTHWTLDTPAWEQATQALLIEAEQRHSRANAMRSTRALGAAARRLRSTAAAAAPSAELASFDLFNPTAEHRALRELTASFVETEVEPQALEYNRAERFNHELFRRTGELGLLGVTVDPEYGGSGMDAAAACIVHEELSYSDPAFCLSYPGTLAAFREQSGAERHPRALARLLPRAVSGELIGGMGMSEPSAGTDVLGMSPRPRSRPTVCTSSLGRRCGSRTARRRTPISAMPPRVRAHGRARGQGLQGHLALPHREGHRGLLAGSRLKDKAACARLRRQSSSSTARVPAENLVGDEGGATVCMMQPRDRESCTAAMAVGIARRSLQAMNTYANERKASATYPLWADSSATADSCARARPRAPNPSPSPSSNPNRRTRAPSPSRTGPTLAPIRTHRRYAEYMAGKTYLYQTAAQLDMDSAGSPRPSPSRSLPSRVPRPPTPHLRHVFRAHALGLSSPSRRQPARYRRRQALLHDDGQERRRPRDAGDGWVRLHGRKYASVLATRNCSRSAVAPSSRTRRTWRESPRRRDAMRTGRGAGRLWGLDRVTPHETCLFRRSKPAVHVYSAEALLTGTD